MEDNLKNSGHTRKLDTASAPNIVAWAKMIPQGRTSVCSLCVRLLENWAFSTQFPVADLAGHGSDGEEASTSEVPTVPEFA